MRGSVHESPDDEELIASCLAGQEDAWETLAERLHRLAYRLIAFHQAWSPSEVDDLVQEVLAILLANDRRLLRAYDPHRARLSTYLAVFLRRRAAAQQRKQQRERSFNQLSPDFEPHAHTSADAQANEAWDLVERTLPPVDVLILRYTVMGYHADEIASLLSHSHGRPFTAEAIRQRRSRAGQRLRRLRPAF